ncbi:MAG: hypothetical protein KC435_06085 [Thermomicrobiales bacterium]|nr:hypothetical protein [Thermomicrobiales bacterium]
MYPATKVRCSICQA